MKFKRIRERFLSHIFLLVWFFGLSSPMMVHLCRVEPQSASTENRRLAELPTDIFSIESGLAWPAKMDQYLQDSFGLRQYLIGLNNQIKFQIFGEAASPQLTIGKDQVIFFNSHDQFHPYRMLNFLCGRNVDLGVIDELSTRVRQFLDSTLQNNPNTTVGFVPTKPVLYTEYLPNWLQTDCRPEKQSLHLFQMRMMQLDAVYNLGSEKSLSIYYPLDEMRKKKTKVQLYPKEDFHWHGRGAQVYAQDLSERIWQLPALRKFDFFQETVDSDMQRFMPGVQLRPTILSPDYKSANIDACLGPQCFPELTTANKLNDISRYQSNVRRQDSTLGDASKTGKLLIVSDSFGNGVAGYFSAYFDEVWHISINYSSQLSPTEKNQLRLSLEKFDPDKVLYLFHDFSLTCFSERLNYCPINLVDVLTSIHPKRQ